jgi:hypothetical protein
VIDARERRVDLLFNESRAVPAFRERLTLSDPRQKGRDPVESKLDGANVTSEPRVSLQETNAGEPHPLTINEPVCVEAVGHHDDLPDPKLPTIVDPLPRVQLGKPRALRVEPCDDVERFVALFGGGVVTIAHVHVASRGRVASAAMIASLVSSLASRASAATTAARVSTTAHNPPISSAWENLPAPASE